VSLSIGDRLRNGMAKQTPEEIKATVDFCRDYLGDPFLAVTCEEWEDEEDEKLNADDSS